MWRGPPLFIQVVKVSCYSRQFILIIRYTAQRTTFYSNGRPISHSHITPLSPAPPARAGAVPEIFFNPENIFWILFINCDCAPRRDVRGKWSMRRRRAPLRCGKIFFVEDENNFSLLVVSSPETGDRCVSAPRKMIDGGGDLTFKLKHLSLVSATSFLYILHKLWSGMKHPQLILESYKA